MYIPWDIFPFFALGWISFGAYSRSSCNIDRLILNTLRPRQNGHWFQDDKFKCVPWMKIQNCGLRSHRSLCPRDHLTIFQLWFRWLLGAGWATSRYLNQWWLVYWRLFASLGHNDLMLNHFIPTTQNGIWLHDNNIMMDHCFGLWEYGSCEGGVKLMQYELYHSDKVIPR